MQSLSPRSGTYIQRRHNYQFLRFFQHQGGVPRFAFFPEYHLRLKGGMAYRYGYGRLLFRGMTMVACMKEGASRREFVRAVTGAAVIGSITGLDLFTAGAYGASENRELLVAPCGLYCGACPMYLATRDKDEGKIKALLQQFNSRDSSLTIADLQCDGCIAGGRVASFCRECAMRDCAEKKQRVARCADCGDFPCKLIADFNDDGMLHHAEVLENCRGIREMGIAEWARHEEKRWRCSQCEENISWYDPKCPQCGTRRSGELFPLRS
jgi:hypothetical protein